MASKSKTALLQRTPDEDAPLQRAPLTPDVELEADNSPVAPAARGGYAQRAYGNQFVQRMSRFDAHLTQRSAGDQTGGEVSDSVEQRIEGQIGAGQPLAESTRAPYESSLGADFSEVRVHTGAEAGRLNRSLGAKAFTTGSDIFFGENQFEPDSSSGQKLIAHELTHVVQQGAAGLQPQRQTQRQPLQREEEEEPEAEKGDDPDAAAEDGAQAAEERVEASIEEQVEAERESGDEAGTEVPTMAQVIEEAVAEVGPVEMPEAPAAEAADSAEPTELPVGIQAKMEVSAADDAYEQEADAIANQVVEGGAQRAEDDEVASVQPARPMQLQRSARRGMVQREEDIEAEEEAERQREEEELNSRSDAPSEEERRDQEAQAKDKGTREGEQQGEQEGRANAPEEEEGDTDVQDAGGDAVSVNVPELPPIPEEPPPAPESKPVDVLEAEQDEMAQAAPEQAEVLAAGLGFASSKPANWDEETAFHELFATAALGGPDASAEETAQALLPKRLLNLQRFANAGKPPAITPITPGSSGTTAPKNGVQRDVAAESGNASSLDTPSNASTKWEGGDWLLEKRDDDVIPVPRHENAFAQAMIGDTASKGAETVNKFASIRNETNIFGMMATLLEGAIKILELVTAIIGIISLVLTIVAMILYAVGAAMMAFFGAGAPLIAAAAKLTAVVAKLTAVTIKILIVRIKMRVIAIQLRILDVLMMLAFGADMKDIKRKLWMMAEQGIGIVTDGVSLALAMAPAKIQGSQWFQKTFPPSAAGAALQTTATAGGKGAGLALLSVVGSGAGRVASGSIAGGINEGKEAAGLRPENKEPVATAPDELAGDRTAVEETTDDGERVELLPPPRGVDEVIEGTAVHLADAGQEKAFLVSRIATIDEVLIKKIQWNEDMNLMHTEIASEKASLESSDQILDQNIATTEKFAEEAQKGQGPAAEAAHGSEGVGGDMHGMQGQLDSSVKRAESEKPGQMGNVDKGQMAGGPSQSKEGSAQAGETFSEGISQAGEAKSEALESKDHNAEARDLATDADEKVTDVQAENEQDVQHLLEEKEACLARLAEIESKEVELTQLRDEAVGEATDWADDHAEKRERVMAGSASE